jgi:DNA-binding transcriptional MerR regulator
MPYPTDLAAQLSGASLRQLQYWQAGGEQSLFVPELPKARGRVLYSFRDLVALRTFVYLREAVSLQRIRKAVGNLRELGNTEHLSKYQLVVAGKSVVLVEPGQDAGVDLVESPGAQRFTITLGDVFAPFKNQRGDQVVDLFHPRRHVTIDPDVRGGFPLSRAPAWSSTSSPRSYGMVSTRARCAISILRFPPREQLTPPTSPTRSIGTATASSGLREAPAR